MATVRLDPPLIEIKAPTVQPGDLIDGRRVQRVTGRKPRSCTASYHSAIGSGVAASKGKARPSITFSGHVVCIYFDDGGPPKYVFGNRTIRVARP